MGRTEYGFSYTRIDHLLRLVNGSAEYARTDQVAVRASDRVYTGGIGVRYRRGSGRLRPFVQFLAGLASTKRVENPPTPLPLGCDHTCRQLPTHSQQMLIVQPGVGLDIQLADRFALRVQGDLQGFLVEEYHAPCLGQPCARSWVASLNSMVPQPSQDIANRGRTVMQVRSPRVIAIVALTTLAISASARAQNIPAGEILGAYQIASWSSPGTVASGWFVSAARNFSDRMSFVFELGRAEHGGTYTSHHEVFVSEHTNRLFRHRNTMTAPPGKHLGTERITKRSSESVSVAGLGVRYRHVPGKAVPFFQVLGGFALGSDKDDTPESRRPDLCRFALYTIQERGRRAHPAARARGRRACLGFASPSGFRPICSCPGAGALVPGSRQVWLSDLVHDNGTAAASPKLQSLSSWQSGSCTWFDSWLPISSAWSNLTTTR